MQIKGLRARTEEFLNEVISVLPKFEGVSYRSNSAYTPHIIIRYKEEFIDKIPFNFSDVSIEIDETIEHLNKRIPLLIKRHENLLTFEEVQKEEAAFKEVMGFIKESCVPVTSKVYSVFSRHHRIPESKIYIHHRIINWLAAYSEVGHPKHQSVETRCFKISRSASASCIQSPDSGFKPTKFKRQLKKALSRR